MIKYKDKYTGEIFDGYKVKQLAYTGYMLYKYGGEYPYEEDEIEEIEA